MEDDGVIIKRFLGCDVARNGGLSIHYHSVSRRVSSIGIEAKMRRC